MTLLDSSKKCTRCKLYKTCHTQVFGEGKKDASVMFVGEAPGANEDIKGRPFVGRAGQTLRQFIRMFDLEDDCYITNVVCCRPPGNRNPEKDEITACLRKLKRRIDRVNPKVIVVLGNVAMKALTGLQGIMKRRGKPFYKDNYYYLPMLHPAYIERNPANREELLKDMANDFEKLTALLSKGDEEANYRYITSKREAVKVLRMFARSKRFTFDIEATDTNIFAKDFKVLGIGFSKCKGEAYFIPLFHRDTPFNEAQLVTIVRELGKTLGSKAKKVLQNAKYDIECLEVHHGIVTQNLDFDTMIAHKVLHPDELCNLDVLSWKYTDLGGYKGQFKEKVKNNDFESTKIEDLAMYCCGDCDAQWQIYLKLRKEIRAHPKLYRLLRTIHLPMVYILKDMEIAGIKIDVKWAKKIGAHYLRKMREQEEELFATKAARVFRKVSGGNPNFDKPAHLSLILYDILGLPILERTPKKKMPSTGKAVLGKLAEKHRIPKLIIESRKTRKLYGTFILPMLEKRYKDGRIHSKFSQTRTASFRLASENPNLQNIPVRDIPNEYSFRKMFISKDDWWFMEWDLSQIELRTLAVVSRDPRLLRAYELGEDLHTMTAAGMFGIPLSEVTKMQRYIAKTINFGLLYGAGVLKIYNALIEANMKISMESVSEFIDNWFKLFKDVKKWMDRTRRFAHANGFVTSISGRHRSLPAIHSNNDAKRAEAERQGLNFPIQSPAHEITETIMIAFSKFKKKLGLKARMVLQVHDSVIKELPREEIEIVGTFVTCTVENIKSFVPWFDIPLAANIEVGKRWGNLKTWTPPICKSA